MAYPSEARSSMSVKLNSIQALNLKLDSNNILLNILINDSDLGITVSDFEGSFLKVNPPFQKMTGYSEEELLTLTTFDIIHPHDFKMEKSLLDELGDGKRNQYTHEKRFITKSGEIIYTSVTSYKLDNPHGHDQILTIIQNLSAHHKIITELKSDQTLFTALLDNSRDRIYYKDLEGRFIKVNNAVAKVHNFPSPESLIGKSDFDIFTQEHATESHNDEQEIIRSGKPLIGKEERIVWPDGSVSWVSTSKMPFYDSRGSIKGTIGLTRDITKHKLTEEQLVNERIMMRTLLNNLPDAIYVKDIDCRKTFLNKSDMQNLGCESEEDAIGKTDFDFLPPEIATGFYADDLSVISSGKPILNREELLRDDKGNEKWLLTSKLPFCNDEGKIVGLVGIGHDITARRKSEKVQTALYQISEAANSTSDFPTLYKRLHEIIQTLIPAKNFYICLYNEATDIISFPYFIDERIKTMRNKKLGNGLNHYVIENGFPLLANSEKINELNKEGYIKISYTPAAVWLGVPLKSEGQCIGAIVVRDYENKDAYNEDDLQLLTFVSAQVAQAIERKKSSEAIQTYAKELQQLNQTKDKFFSIIAHDLKNPFITILGFSELLHTDFSELTDEEKLYYIAEMKKSAETSHNLLQNLLQWSRSQTGRIDFNPASISIDELIFQNIILLTPTAERKNVTISYTADHNNFVFADSDMIDTVIRNLISNAIKFTNKNGKIIISTDNAGPFIRVSVNDNGTGMSKEVKEKLFRLDVNQSTAGTDNETGTGLGLILCKEFIQKNRGAISVESKEGEGSTFHFTLPKG